jgi:hypothetical protein
MTVHNDPDIGVATQTGRHIRVSYVLIATSVPVGGCCIRDRLEESSSCLVLATHPVSLLHGAFLDLAVPGDRRTPGDTTAGGRRERGIATVVGVAVESGWPRHRRWR